MLVRPHLLFVTRANNVQDATHNKSSQDCQPDATLSLHRPLLEQAWLRVIHFASLVYLLRTVLQARPAPLTYMIVCSSMIRMYDCPFLHD